MMSKQRIGHGWFLVGRFDRGDRERLIRVAPLPFRVGRSADSSLRIASIGVSIEHAELFALDDDLWIRDLDSTNGTYVNGRQVTSEAALRHGDIVHFADLPFQLTATDARDDADALPTANERMGEILAATDEWIATVDALPQLILLLDPDGRVRRVNRTLERWNLGDVKAVGGRHFHRVLHPGCRDQDCELSRTWLAALERLERHDELRAVEGGYAFESDLFDAVLKRHFVMRVHPTQHRTDGEWAFTMALEDVSERKKSELGQTELGEKLLLTGS